MPKPFIYQIKITLLDSSPPIWRRVLIAGNTELSDVHHIIQAVMPWDDYHLHQFISHPTSDMRTFYAPDGDFMLDETIAYEAVVLSDLLQKPKQKIHYEYDFGDSWQHEILLEKIFQPESKQRLPFCLTGKRACPPEDCGGIYGYYGWIDIFNNPTAADHSEAVAWLGEDFNPEAFSVEETNQSLAMLFSSAKRGEDVSKQLKEV